MKLRHLFLLAPLFVGCSVSNAPDEPTATASASIAKVPSDGTCVEIIVAGTRTVDQLFDLTAGAGSTLSLQGLPVGSVAVTARAYGAACSTVTAATIPTWLSDPSTATLTAGSKTPLTIKLHRNGGSDVTLDFDDGALTCSTGTADCDANAANGCEAILATDNNNCGACGTKCSTGTSCVAGACTATTTCAPGLVKCGTACVDTTYDDANCGGCGHTCVTFKGFYCESGICTYEGP